MKKYQVYRIDDTETGHYYIGMHMGNIFEDGYWGGGRGMVAHLRKHGKGNLKRVVLHELTDEINCADMEAELVTWDTVNDPLCLNRQPGGNYQGPLSNETRKRLSESHRGKVGLRGEENGMYGKSHSEESRKKMSEAHIGHSHSEETKRKIGRRKFR